MENDERERERETTNGAGPFLVHWNRYESCRYKLAVRSDVMAIYGTILREDSSNRREYRYGMCSLIPLPTCLSLPPSILHLSPSSSRRCAAYPSLLSLSLSATSEVRECSREGQRSLRGFSEIWRLKPPVGLVTTQFAGVPMV